MVKFLGKCADCGATNNDPAVGKCAHCKADLTHDEKTCGCEPCQTKQDMEAGRQGWSLLMQMKRDKQDLKARAIKLGLERASIQITANAITCPKCGLAKVRCVRCGKSPVEPLNEQSRCEGSAYFCTNDGCPFNTF